MSIPERKHVLVVDDEPGIVELVATIVTMAGYVPHCADSAEAALVLLPNIADDICLVISDVTMGDMSGTELAHAVRRLHPTLPVLLISGYVQDAIEINQLPAGVTFKQKPIKPAEIREILHSTCSNA